MQTLKNTFLKFIEFSEFPVWDVKSFFISQGIFKKNVPLVLFGDFLSKYETTKINIENDHTYKILGVRVYGKGVFINREVKGNTLKMKKYQLADENTLFWCKVDTKNGGFGIIKDEHIGGLGSTNMFFAKINITKINKDYLQMLFQSSKINAYMDQYVTGTTNRKYIKPGQLLNEIKIPLPSLSEQNKIVENYNNNFKKAEKAEKRVLEAEKEIESYLMKELGIGNEKKGGKINNNLLNFTNLINIDKWGVKYLLNNLDLGEILKSKLYSMLKLKDIIHINPKTLFDKEKNISFIPMKYISDKEGKIIKKDIIKGINSKGYTRFQEGDLIWSRITPCMQNGKSAIVKNLENGIGCGSTEYHVLRNTNKNIDLHFIYMILRLDKILQFATNYFTGTAGQQRVPKEFLEDLQIPLPPLKIQEKIVNHIGKLKDEIKELKSLALELRESAKGEFEGEIFSN